jgi:hypothetical protein
VLAGIVSKKIRNIALKGAALMATGLADLEQLLHKVELAPDGTSELDREFAEVFSKAPPQLFHLD